MHVSNYKATFPPIHLVFLELDIDQPHLDFKILDESNNEVIPVTFYLQLLNKKRAYTTMKPKIYPDLKPRAPQEPQSYGLWQNCQIEAFCPKLRHFFLMKLRFVNKLPKK